MTPVDENRPADLPAMSPPTASVEPAGAAEVESRWPSVIGAVSIVLASLGLVCYGCGSLQVILSPWMAGMMPEDQRPVPPGTAQFILQIAQVCIVALLSAWLLIAGIGLVRRRSWARSSHAGWAFVKIIITAISTVISFIFLEDSVKQMNDQLSQSGISFSVTETHMIIVMLATFVWFLIYPVFLILWFSRASVKDEVAAWRGPLI